MLSYPAADAASTSTKGALPIPLVTLLEYNASPDFHQSGDRLRPHLAEMFRGVVRLSVAPFFGLDVLPEKDSDDAEPASAADGDETRAPAEVGEEKWGWRLVGKGEIRSFGA